jgi:hypothetical protein
MNVCFAINVLSKALFGLFARVWAWVSVAVFGYDQPNNQL